MRRIKIILTFVISILLLSGLSTVEAAPVTVGTVTNNTFTITRTITNAKANVTNTFGYSITADGHNPSGVTGVPTSSSVIFNNTTPISGTATATGTINLSGVSFTKNGDYKYVVRENSSSDSTNYPIDTDDFYTIQISVRNNSESDFSGKTVTITCLNKSGTKLDNANLTFTKDGSFTYISISNTLEGNMANVDEYFKVKVIINGTNGDTYTISGQSYTGADKQTTYTVGSDNYIYLKHGETITIGKNGNTSEIPKNITYSFEEMDATDYDTYINNSTTESKSSPELTTSQTNNNTIKNTYEEPTITGVFLKIAPYILIVAVAAILVIYLVIKNKKEKSNEQN